MRVSALAIAVLLVSGTKGSSAGPEPPRPSFAARAVPKGALAQAVTPASSLAAERLGTSACRGIFEELPDFTGRPVARRLEAGERSPSSHFARLTFLGSTEGPCRYSGTAAWSVAGDTRVRVCARTFGAVAAHDRREAAAVLIHEALHTLGVGEDAAKEPLTAFVRRRCGL
ncbi:MAG TPA: hypothetical protein PLB01_06570 [Thermoanaerobaculia bacterium]|nr:hypothetical protein [Thermoanaerobaculia bacterium]